MRFAKKFHSSARHNPQHNGHHTHHRQETHPMCKDSGNMPPKLEKETPTDRVQVLAPRTWIVRVDEWRSQQRPIPSRSEAIRQLVNMALKPSRRRR
jgi:hypothetical protein